MDALSNADGSTSQYIGHAWWRCKRINNRIGFAQLSLCKPFVFTIYKKRVMPTTGIGYITTGSFNRDTEQFSLSTDESICGLLFDTTYFQNPFDDYPLIQQYLGNEQTIVINNLTEAAMYGLSDNQFMNGVSYYHIKAFYDYVGADAPLYICFTSDGQKWSAVEKMQSAANGKIFQIGIWTAQCIWNVSSGTIGFTDLCSNLEDAAEELTGKVGTETMNTSPLSLIVSPNTSISLSGVALQDVPTAISLDLPKLSVCLFQNGTDAVHTMQNTNPYNAPVGCIGLLMACLHLAYAEECIGYVAKFNLNKNDDFENAEIYFGGKYIGVDEITYLVGNYVAMKGYIMPCTYSGKEAEVFFSGDPTLSDGDYNVIANNRIMHKCRRCVYSALLPYIHANHLLDTTSSGLSDAAQTIITSAIGDKLDAIMINNVGESQIDGRAISISKSDTILTTDAISVDLSIGLVNYNKTLNEKDDYIV